MSEMQKPSPMSLDVIEHKVRQLGDRLLPNAVVVGSTAIYAALGDAVRQPNDIDLSVSEEAFRYLRTQPGWEAKEGPAGTHLYQENLDVSMGWAGQSHEDLLARSWRSTLHVANPADVYAHKDHRNTKKDHADLRMIRERFEDPSQPPLPIRIMPDEVRRVKAILPEWLHDHPDASAAIWVAANGLMNVFTKYGHPDIGRSNQIIGTLEQPEYQVPATYHNGFRTEVDLKALMDHLAATGAPAIDFFLALMGESYSDIRYGNGRFSDHSDAKNYDEWLSKQLAEAHARIAGFSEAEARRIGRAILGTTYNEVTREQAGVRDADPIVRAVTAVDFYGLSQPTAVVDCCDITIEDGFSRRARALTRQIIGRVFREMGIRVGSTEQALAVISEYPNAHPSDAPPEGTILHTYATRLGRSAGLLDPSTGIYVPPHDWKFDRPDIRFKHAEKIREISTRLRTDNKAKRITATQSYEMAHEHANTLERTA